MDELELKIMDLLNDSLGEEYLFAYNPETDKRKIALRVPELKGRNLKIAEYEVSVNFNTENTMGVVKGAIQIIAGGILRDFCIIGSNRTTIPRIILADDGLNLSGNSISIKVGFLLRGLEE